MYKTRRLEQTLLRQVDIYIICFNLYGNKPINLFPKEN